MAKCQSTHVRISQEMLNTLCAYARVAQQEAESLSISLDMLARQPGSDDTVKRIHKIAESIALGLADLAVEIGDHFAPPSSDQPQMPVGAEVIAFLRGKGGEHVS